jgi:ABC-type sugar transport system ATPase subunit
MDEPFSSLDALTRETAQEFLLEVRRTRRLTMLVVTHSIEEAAYLAESVFVMTGRNPGTITERFDIPENRSELRFRAELASAEPARPVPASTPAEGHPSDADDFRANPRYLELCAAIRSSLRGAGRTDDGALPPGAVGQGATV